jgi:hypothetical protein
MKSKLGEVEMQIFESWNHEKNHLKTFLLNLEKRADKSKGVH